MMHTLSVEVPGATYPLVVAPTLSGLGEAVASTLAPHRCIVVTNPVVADLHLRSALDALGEAGVEAEAVLVPDGEPRKTVATWQRLLLDVLGRRPDRSTPIVALGGGVTGDIAGFVAATALRGLPLVQVPTTLLAMVDSAVGGKVGVNTPQGKNLVGAFHQPALVYAALDCLETLPAAERAAGLAEVLKHGLIGDAELMSILEQRAEALVAGTDRRALAQCVLRSGALKAAVVAEDALERGRRVVLNYGHTVGHAIETVLGGRWRHGHCVAVGLLAEARWAEARGLTDNTVVERIEALLPRLSLATTVPDGLTTDALRAAARHDKKRARGMLRTAVVPTVGAVRTVSENVAVVDEMVDTPNVRTADPRR